MIVSYPRITKVEGEHPWVTYGKSLIDKRNKCMNLIVVGEPGSGKSWGLLSYLYQIYPDFNINTQCFWRGEDIINKVNDLLVAMDENKKITKEERIFMFDESGIDLYNLNWRDMINTSMNHFWQTGRSLNYINGLTVPYISLLSSPVRKLMTHRFIAEGWIKSNNTTKMRAHRHEWNDEKKKPYYKTLQVNEPSIGCTVPCKHLYFKKAPKKIIDEYEIKKKKFQRDIMKEIKDNMEDKKRIKKAEDEKKSMVKCTDVAREMGVTPETIINWAKKNGMSIKRIVHTRFMKIEDKNKLISFKND